MTNYKLFSLQTIVPGPPFAFGAVLVIMALLVAAFMPESPHANKKNKLVTAESFELKDAEAGGKIYIVAFSSLVSTGFSRLL